MQRTRQAPSWLRLALIATLLVAFALRLLALTEQNIWWDEARNIDVALRPFTEIATAPELDIQPPFYYWLLHLWLRIARVNIGDTPETIAFFSRILSVWCGVIAVALLAPLSRLLTGGFHSADNSTQRAAPLQLAALYAPLIGALSPFWLAESQETRMYTLGFALLAGAAVNLGIAIGDWRLASAANPQSPIPNPQSQIRHLAAFVLLSTLALLTHYNALFILVAWYGWAGVWALLQPDRWRRLLTIVLCGLSMCLMVLPMLPIALRQIPDYANANLTVPSLIDYLWQNWQAYLAGYAYDPAAMGGYATAWLWLALVIFLAGLIFTVFQRPPLRVRSSLLAPFSFLLVWLLAGLLLYYLAVLDRGAFNVRYSSFVTPALYTLLGVGLAAWGARWRGLGVAALALIVMGMLPFVRADLYDSRFAREEIGNVSQWLRENAGPDDLVLVDQKYPFGFYYKRFAIDPLVTPAGPEPAPARYLFVDINTLDQRLNEWAGDARRVFWVQWFESDTDPRHAVGFLLNQAGSHAGEQWFQGYSIDWWEMEPPSIFALASSMTPLQVIAPPAVQTIEVSLPGTPIAPGQPVGVTLRWQRVPGGAVTRPLKARVALYDAADNRLAQADERLLNDRHLAPSEWSDGDHPLNVYLIETQPDLTAGDYKLKLLIYDAETLEPLSLADAAGNPAGIEAEIGALRVEK